MQTCSQCNYPSADEALFCSHCQADLRQFSLTAVVRRKLLSNERVSAVRIEVAHDACPACQNMRATYQKDQVPILPVKGCSHPHGCRCFYAPCLEEIYP
ncbi:MAG: zinc ribbon domain-containing protein [Anaerolineaceae bacterium]